MFANLGAIISLLLELVRFIEDCVSEEQKKEKLSQLEDGFRIARTQKDTTQLNALVNGIIANSK